MHKSDVVSPYFVVHVQIGSLVDGADEKGGRNAAYKYFDTPSSAEFGDFSVTRTTLVQTTRHLKAGEEVLVFYGSEYKASAMPHDLPVDQD